MKTVENRGFGVIGIKVELSFIELLLIREQLSIIAESDSLDTQSKEPDDVALLNVVMFCEKLTVSNLGEEMRKAGKLLFADDEALEDLKNECELNGLENESPER